MTSPVETTTLDTSAKAAVEAMLMDDYAGLMVTPKDDDRVVIGVITATDRRRCADVHRGPHMDVHHQHLDARHHHPGVDRREHRQVSDKYAEHAGDARSRPLPRTQRETPRYADVQCQIRLRTNKGHGAGTGEGSGAENSFRVGVDKLERNVLEVKPRHQRRGYRGQLLRKLNQL